MQHRCLSAPVILAIAGLAPFAPSAALAQGLPTGYTVISIGTFPDGGASRANAINSSGDAVGRASTVNLGSNDRAVLFSQGALTDVGVLDIPFPLSCEAFGINDGGSIVGSCSNGVGHAFLFSGGRMSNLETSLANAFSSQAFSINSQGAIVGTAVVMIDA